MKSLYDILEQIEYDFGFVPEKMIQENTTWDDYTDQELKEMYLEAIDHELRESYEIDEESRVLFEDLEHMDV